MKPSLNKRKPTQKRGPGKPALIPGDPSRSTNVVLPGSFFKRINALVEAGVFQTKSEALRGLIEEGLRRFEKK